MVERIAVTALLIALAAPAARGQAILAPGARTLFNKNVLVRSFTHIQRQSISRDGRVLRRTRYVQPVALIYGMGPDLSVTAVAPFVVAESNGWADSQFFVKYDGLIKRNEPRGLTRLAAEVGVQAPTGTEPFSTGAVAFLGGLLFKRVANQKYFIADVQHKAATRNAQGVTTGNNTRFDLAAAYLWVSQPGKERTGLGKFFGYVARHGIYTLLELNAEIQNRARGSAGAIRNTGGGTVLLSPGLQYFARRNLIVEFSAPIPVVRKLNGLQPRPRVGFLLGFRYLL